MTVSNRIVALALNCRFGNSFVVRQDFPSVDLQGLFLIAAHQIDVELRDADFPQRFQFLTVLFDGADKAKAVDDLIGHKISVVAADFAMVQVVVLTTIFHKRNQRRGQLFRLVFRNEVHYVIGDERGEPAHAFAGKLQIGRGPDWRGGHHFDFCWVAAGFFGALADKAKGPFDQIRIGKLQDDAVTNAPGGAQCFWSITGHPDWRNAAVGPRKTRAYTFKLDGFSRVERAERSHEFFEILERSGLFAEHAARAVSAANAELHAAARENIQRGE